MELQSFRKSLEQTKPPEHISVFLQALWYDAKGMWEEAHALIQDNHDPDASWIHAYLHRKEGDLWNADWWYRKANKNRPDQSLEDEWTTIAKTFLE